MVLKKKRKNNYTQYPLSEIKQRLYEMEEDIAKCQLRDGDIDQKEHDYKLKSLKKLLKRKGIRGLYDMLEEVGYEYDEANKWILEIIIDKTK